MNLNDLAAKTAAIIEANKDRTFAEIENQRSLKAY